MLKNEYPTDLGNATIITNRTARGNGLIMLRWEDIFDFFSEEPVSITVKEKENSCEEDYESILRIRIWNHRKKVFLGVYIQRTGKYGTIWLSEE